MNAFDKIAETQYQGGVESVLRRTIGVNSNQIGKFMNQASSIIQQNDEKQKAQQRSIQIEVTDTSETDELKSKCEELIHDIKERINNYEAIAQHEEKMNKLHKIRHNDHKTLSERMGTIVGTVYTNNRRVDYQTPELARIGHIRFLLILVFYICIAIYIKRSRFIPRNQYRRYRPMGILLSLLIFPFFIDTFVIQGYKIFNNVSFFLDNSAPKNVYTNI